MNIQGLTSLFPAGVLAVRRGGINKENVGYSGISGLAVEGLREVQANDLRAARAWR
jgi:hypothetical protein